MEKKNPIRQFDAEPGEKFVLIDDSIVPGVRKNYYFVTNYGNVYGAKMSPATKSYKMTLDVGVTGSPRARLQLEEGSPIRIGIAQLVVRAFVPNNRIDELGMTILWKDGNRLNNRLDNLIWWVEPIVELPLMPGEVAKLLTEKEYPGILPFTYFVTNCGRIFSVSGHNGQKCIEILRRPDYSGYIKSVLYTPNYHVQIPVPVHRAVMYAFRWFDGCTEMIDATNYRYQVNHKMINGKTDVSDNYVDPNGILENDHLEWCDNEYNAHYNWLYNNRFRKLTEDQVLDIMNMYNSGIMMFEIAKKYEVPQSVISNIINHKTYKEITEKYQS